MIHTACYKIILLCIVCTSSAMLGDKIEYDLSFNALSFPGRAFQPEVGLLDNHHFRFHGAIVIGILY